MRSRGYTSKLASINSFTSLGCRSSGAACSRINFCSKASLTTSVRVGSSSSSAAEEEGYLAIREAGTSRAKATPSTFMDEGGLFPLFKGNGWREPSRRYRRQLEQRFGPLWRYHALALADTSLSTLTTTPAADVKTAPTGLDGAQREKDATLEASGHRTRKARTGQADLTSTSSPLTTSTGPPSSADSFGSKPIQNPAGADPLLQFLESNEEEAVVILSMLTSLQRCCHYRSEISEALSLRVRYFFHSLIHRHAIAAAWSLYERLLQMGITLRHNDLVLLLTSLPYEASASEERIKQYIREAEKAEKDRRDKRRRELLWKEEQMKTQAKHQGAVSREAAKGALAHSKEEEDVPHEKQASPPPTSVVRTTAGPSSTAASEEEEAAVSVFASKPEWVRRWAMYEASMGNLDFSDSHQATLPTEATNPIATVVDGLANKTSFRENVTEWDAHDDEMNKTSTVTISLMELEAVVEHLYVMQSYSTGAALNDILAPPKSRPKKNKGGGVAARRPSVSLRAMNGANYAREALRVVRRFVEHQKVKGGDTTTVLSASLVDKLRSLIRVSASFKLTSQYLTFLTRDAPSCATESDGLMYLLHLSERQRVGLKPHEERFIDETVLPLFTAGSTASYVACAWWTSYLCHVKTSRPDDFMELLLSARERFGWGAADKDASGDASSPAEDHMQLLDVIRESIESVSHATSRLSDEIQSFLSEEKLHRAMATEGPTVTRVACEEQGLPPALQDTFSYLCITIVQVCSLASAAVVRTDPQSLATLYTFIERVVYGSRGIWAIFQSTYTLDSGDGRAAALEGAPERTTMCCVVARCVLLVAQELCLNGSIHHASNTTNPIKLLLELGLGALEEVSSQGSQLNSVTVKALVEIRCTLLLLIKRLYTFLDLTPKNQRVLFGAIRSESVDCLVLYAKLLHRVEVTLHSEAIHRLLLRTTPVRERKTVIESATPKTREILRLCFVPGNALSSQIGGLLSKRDREWLLTYMRQKKRCTALRTSKSATVSVAHRFNAIPLERRVSIHDSVYRIALEDQSSMEMKLLALSDALIGEECLFLLHLLMKNVCIADGVLSTRFFVTVLQKVSSEQAPKGMTERREEVARPSTNKNVTWMDAIGIFWSAVDHTRSPAKLSDPRQHERDVLNQLLCPLLQVANQIHQRDVGRQWRKTWARKFSHAEKQHSHFLTLNAKALALLGDDSALDRTVHLVQASEKTTGATSATPPVAAATTTPSTDEPTAAPEDLLLRAAEQHRSWQAALAAVFKVYGDFAEHEEVVNPYKPVVAHTLLTILSKSRTNLSNTGLRIQTIQRDLWDVQSAVLLMKLLLRARRWKKTLQVLESTQKSPEFKHIHQYLTNHPVSPQKQLGIKDVLLYAELHMLALQACAIGGEGEKAALLFEHLKDVLSHFDHTAAADAADSDAASDGGQAAFEDVDELERIFDSARLDSDVDEERKRNARHRAGQEEGEPRPQDSAADALELAQLREVVMRGRRLFLRATTKKMMKTPFSPSEKD